MHIFCGKLVTPFEVLEDMLVTIEGTKIAALEHISARPQCNCGYPHRKTIPQAAIDASEDIISPGFIDVHIHGGAGYDTMDATMEALDGISRHLASAGVTSFLPSTISSSWEDMVNAVRAVSEAMAAGVGGAEILGVHLEGPYLNPERKGAHPEQFLRVPSVDEFRNRLGQLSSIVKIVTLAPEVPGAQDLIRYLCARNITVSIGHSEATFEQAISAIDAGARHATHLFNAMRPLKHRDPGIVGAILADDRVRAEIIWDNLHLHPGTARSTIKAKGADRTILVSDAMRACGLGDGQYKLGAHDVYVRDGEARLADGTIASSMITLDMAVRNAAMFFPLEEAIRMATYVPAYDIGVEQEKGSIAVGKDADLVILSEELHAKQVILQGALLEQTASGNCQARPKRTPQGGTN